MTKPAASNAAITAAEVLPSRIEYVRLDQIEVPKDYPRSADADWVHVLGKSMAEAGQLQPIRVVEHEDGRLELNFGLARLMAATEIGWSTIEAKIVPVAALEGGRNRLSTLFENLVRHDFNALERALALHELKQIHEALYPETKNGGDSKTKQALKGQNAKMAFWWEASERTGLSHRAIYRAIEIAEGLTEPSLERARSTWVADHAATLLELSAITPYQQGAVLDLLLADKPRASTVADALILLAGNKLPTPAEKAFRSLSDGLTRLGPKARTAIYDRFEAEIISHLKGRGRI